MTHGLPVSQRTRKQPVLNIRMFAAMSETGLAFPHVNLAQSRPSPGTQSLHCISDGKGAGDMGRRKQKLRGLLFLGPHSKSHHAPPKGSDCLWPIRGPMQMEGLGGGKHHCWILVYIQSLEVCFQ